jgi:hypothetical protein
MQNIINFVRTHTLEKKRFIDLFDSFHSRSISISMRSGGEYSNFVVVTSNDDTGVIAIVHGNNFNIYYGTFYALSSKTIISFTVTVPSA